VFVGCSDAALAALSDYRQAFFALNCIIVSPTGLAGTPGAAGDAMAADTALMGCSIGDKLARQSRYEGMAQSGADAAGDEEEFGELDREVLDNWVAPIVPRSGFGARELVRLGLGPGCVDVWRISGAAETLDRARRVLGLADGRNINYDLLILATGLREGGAERAVARGRKGGKELRGGIRSSQGRDMSPDDEQYKRGVLAALKPGRARRAVVGGTHDGLEEGNGNLADAGNDSDADEDELSNEHRSRPWPMGVHAVATPEEIAGLCRDISQLIGDCPNEVALEELEGASAAVHSAMEAARAAELAGIEAAAEVPTDQADGGGGMRGGNGGAAGRGDAADDDDDVPAGGADDNGD